MPEYGDLTAEDNAILKAAYGIYDKMVAEMANQQIHRALAAVWDVVAEANRYFAGQEPWALKKTDPARMATVLYVTAEVVRVVGVAIQPFMPESASKLLDLVAVPEEKRFFHVRQAALVPGTELPKPEGVFPRYVEREAES